MFIRYDVRVRFSGHVQKCVNGLKYNVRSDQFMNVYVYSTPGAEGARVVSVCAMCTTPGAERARVGSVWAMCTTPGAKGARVGSVCAMCTTPGAEGARVESVCANRFRVQGFRLVRHAWAGGRGSVGKLGGQGRAGQGGVGWGTGCAGQAGRGLRPPAWCAVRVGRS